MDWTSGQPPDIQPNDWVYAWADSDWTGAQAQICEINGTIDLANDSIEGTIYAPWFPNEVNMEFHPWGAGGPMEMKFDSVSPDGVASTTGPVL